MGSGGTRNCGTERNRSGRAWAWVAIAWVPAVAIAWIVWHYGVNVPYWDDWAMGDFLVKSRTRGIGAGDLFAIHNEGRHVVSRLFALASARITGWDLRASMWASLVVAGVTMAGVLAVARATVGNATVRGVAGVVAGAFVFSVLQFNNWLWGFQLSLFLPAMCLMLGLAATLSPRARGWGKVAACAVAAAVATYGFTNGMILWALLLPGLWWEARISKVRLAVVWAAAAGVCVGGYFYHFHRASWMPPWSETLSRPVELAKFVPVFLGMPIGWGIQGTRQALACGVGGAGMLAVVAAGCVYLAWRGRGGDWAVGRRGWPWVAVGGYAVASAAATAAGRGAAGIAYAMTLRYVTFSTMLPVAVVFLGAVVLDDLLARGTVRGRLAGAVAGAGVAVLLGGNALTVRPALFRAALLHAWELQGKGDLELLELGELPSVKAKLEPFWPGTLGPRAEALDRVGLLHPRIHRTRLVSDYASQDQGVYGAVERVWKEGGTVGAEGWAILPERGEPADDVILAAEHPDGSAVGLAYTDGFVARRDVAEALGNNRYLVCGWRVEVAAGRLPPGTVRLSAWAYDARSGQAHRLGQQVR